jgi:thiol-disulfide isomerase/thioredoxin
MNKIVAALLLVLIMFVAGDFLVKNNYININKPEVEVEVVSDSEILTVLLPQVEKAFDKAEKAILEPGEIDDGTDPDASKCICKGTGVIRQGDGHTTSCKYHGKKAQAVLSLEDHGPSVLETTDSPVEKEKTVEITEKHFNELETSLKSVVNSLTEMTARNEEVVKSLKDELAKAKEEKIVTEVVETPSPVSEVEDTTMQRKHAQKNSAGNLNYQVIIFGAKWCGPCVTMRNEIYNALLNTDIEVSSQVTADVRIVDIERTPDFYNSFRGNTDSIPLIVEIRNNVVVSATTGAKTFEEFMSKYDLEKK